jgi:N-acetylglucosamine-6-phosphate deacetylase
MQITARRYDTRQVVGLRVQQGRIVDIQSGVHARQPTRLPWISPGFVDLQVNGYVGIDFNHPSLTVEDVGRICLALDRHGVTRFCPTVTTDAFSRLYSSVNTIARACEQRSDVADRVAGIHLEGPYISPDDGPRGAHPRAHVRAPDWDEFQRLQEAACGRIRILTLSPEYDGAADFIARVAATGVVVAIGHTCADTARIRSAVDAGARLSTHLGNGTHGLIHRHPNYIWDQLAEDRLTASLIVDGYHLPPEVVKTFVRAKSPQRVILVSDVTGKAGLPPGRYQSASLGAVDVLEDGRLVIAGQRQLLAGAALPISAGVANLLRFSDADLPTAIRMASSQPSVLIGETPTEIQVGAVADLVLFQLPGADGTGPVGELTVTATIHGGRLVFGTLDD